MTTWDRWNSAGENSPESQTTPQGLNPSFAERQNLNNQMSNSFESANQALTASGALPPFELTGMNGQGSSSGSQAPWMGGFPESQVNGTVGTGSQPTWMSTQMSMANGSPEGSGSTQGTWNNQQGGWDQSGGGQSAGQGGWEQGGGMHRDHHDHHHCDHNNNSNSSIPPEQSQPGSTQNLASQLTSDLQQLQQLGLPSQDLAALQSVISDLGQLTSQPPTSTDTPPTTTQPPTSTDTPPTTTQPPTSTDTPPTTTQPPTSTDTPPTTTQPPTSTDTPPTTTTPTTTQPPTSTDTPPTTTQPPTSTDTPPTTTPTSQSNPSGLNHALGFYDATAGNPAGDEQMAKTLNGPVDMSDYFPGNAANGDIAQDSTWLINDVAQWKQQNPNGTPVLAVPLVQSTGGDSLAKAASGGDNTYFTQLAQQMVSGGLGNSVIRLGWEANGNWYPWSATTNPQQYIQAFDNAVTAMRSVPGANFTFDWDVNQGNSDMPAGSTLSTFYPGNKYVNDIGIDAYDNASWSNILGGPTGLNAVEQFSQANGKTMSVDEWGLWPTSQGGQGTDANGDDPTYINNMANFFKNTPNLAFQSFFQGSNPTGPQSLSQNPASQAAYDQDFQGQ